MLRFLSKLNFFDMNMWCKYNFLRRTFINFRINQEIINNYRLCDNFLVRMMHNNTFEGVEDRFKGITVDINNEKLNDYEFKKILDDSLTKWSNEAKRCIWFKINIKDANFVPILGQKGFNFHHARDDYVMMYKWLPKDSDPNLPPASYTNVGVGAIVFNNNSQLLAISEKHYDYPHWKLPGGYVEKGEDIINAAQREVKEETGVDTEFQSFVTFRHTHKMIFGNTDIYIILMMKALSQDIMISDREVKKCKWMDVEEYTNHPHVHAFNKLVVNKALMYKDQKIKLDLKKVTVKWSSFVRDMTFLNVTKDE